MLFLANAKHSSFLFPARVSLIYIYIYIGIPTRMISVEVRIMIYTLQGPLELSLGRLNTLLGHLGIGPTHPNTALTLGRGLTKRTLFHLKQGRGPLNVYPTPLILGR